MGNSLVNITTSVVLLATSALSAGCGAAASRSAADSATEAAEAADGVASASRADFCADSAFLYVRKQVEFGPRVPNTIPHANTADWLEAELKRHGAKVLVQSADLKAFDGTILKARNIFGQFNPDASERLLLLAHWDCRPWADEDPDPAKHNLPVDGANDGASGVGVLLEIARQLNLKAPSKGVDILFVDAEDWGSSGDDNSWALGAKHFTQNPIIENYSPSQAILLDMVGGIDARFHYEYFSQKAAPALLEALWNTAAEAGYADRFIKQTGGAITDDHLQLIEAGIPAVDIIEYNPAANGFNPTWHTSADNLDNISAETLGAVGTTILTFIRNNY